MYKLNDNEVLKYIQEDVPFLDLTTHIQGVQNQQASLEIITREDIVVSCMQEACKIAELLDCVVKSFIPSQQKAKKGDVLLSFNGNYNDVHKAWRSSQVLLEYSCKIATYTYEMKKKIDSVNQNCELLTTRKTFPFSKHFCIKSVITGGGMPHRLNLSETILFFQNHRIIYESNRAFYENIKSFKIKTPEKKIVVESHNLDDAKELMRYGADVLQMDKVDLQTLLEVVKFRDKEFKNIKILASGGIDIDNVKEYASTGIDAVVTSKPYVCGMANLGTKMELLSR
jgi:molybdenum transport protein